jgi:hypothetical protein
MMCVAMRQRLVTGLDSNLKERSWLDTAETSVVGNKQTYESGTMLSDQQRATIILRPSVCLVVKKPRTSRHTGVLQFLGQRTVDFVTSLIENDRGFGG